MTTTTIEKTEKKTALRYGAGDVRPWFPEAAEPPAPMYDTAGMMIRLPRDRPDRTAELSEVLGALPKILTAREHGILLLHAVNVEFDTKYLDADGKIHNVDVPNFQDLADELSSGKAAEGGPAYGSLLATVTDERGVRPISKQAIQQTVVRAQTKVRAFFYSA